MLKQIESVKCVSNNKSRQFIEEDEKSDCAEHRVAANTFVTISDENEDGRGREKQMR